MYPVYLKYCAPHLSLPFILSISFIMALSSCGIHNEREKKLNNNHMYINRFFKDVIIYLFCWQGHSKLFLKLSILLKILKNDAYSRGWATGVMLFASLGCSSYENHVWLTLYNKKTAEILVSLNLEISATFKFLNKGNFFSSMDIITQ